MEQETMTDDLAIQLTYVIARAIRDAGFTIFFGLVAHAVISALSREMSK